MPLQDYTAVIQESDMGWIGWVEEVPGVNCQEPTRQQLLESLQECLREAIEMNRTSAIKEAGDSYEEVTIQA